MVPVRPHPKKGEVYESWLLRVAEANGLPVSSFIRFIWSAYGPTDRATGQRVRFPLYVRLTNDLITAAVASATGQPEEGLQALKLGHHSHHYHPSYLLPFGKLHNQGGWWLATSGGPYYPDTFCPQCFAGDAVLCRIWRAAFTCHCTIHRRPLLDRCPACGEKLDFYNETLPKSGRSDDGRSLHCRNCRVDLCSPVTPSPENELTVQSLLSGIVEGDQRMKSSREKPRSILAAVESMLDVLLWQQRPNPGYGEVVYGQTRSEKWRTGSKPEYISHPLTIRVSLFSQLCSLLEGCRLPDAKLAWSVRESLQLCRPHFRRRILYLARKILPDFLREQKTP